MTDEQGSAQFLGDALVDERALHSAIDETPSVCRPDDDLVDGEPLLASYLRIEMLQTVGKLALAGANPEMLRLMACDVHHAIAVSTRALRTAYIRLLDEFMPATEEECRQGHEEADDPAEDAE